MVYRASKDCVHDSPQRLQYDTPTSVSTLILGISPREDGGGGNSVRGDGGGDKPGFLPARTAGGGPINGGVKSKAFPAV